MTALAQAAQQVTRPTLIVRVIAALWIVAAAFVPVYRAIPGTPAQLWNITVIALIGGTIIFGLSVSPRLWGMWVFAGYAAVVAGITSSANSGFGATLPIAFQLLLILGFAPFAIRGITVRDPRVVARACGAFLIGQTISAAAGVVQLFGTPVLGWAQTNERSPGLSGHPNVLGVMAAVAILICTAAILTKRGPRLLVVGILVVNVAGLITTGSLSSMFACVFGVLVLLYSHGYRILRIAVTGLAVALVTIWVLGLPAVATVLRNPMERFFQVTGQTDEISTLAIRVETFEGAWAYIGREPLLGRGLDGSNASSRDAGTVVHNLFLRGWYQGGIVLAVAIAVILVAVLILTVQAIRAKKHGLAVGVMVTMLSFAMTAAFFEQLYYWLPVLAAWGTLSRGRIERT